MLGLGLWLLLGGVLLAALPLLLRWLRLQWNAWRMHRLTRALPGLPWIPVIGSTLPLLGREGYMLTYLTDLVRRYGYLFRVWLGPVLCVFVLEPEDVEVNEEVGHCCAGRDPGGVVTEQVPLPLADINVWEVVLNSPHVSDKSLLYEFAITPMLGKGLVTLNGQDYRRHRKAVGAALNHKALQQDFGEVFSSLGAHLASRLDALAATGEVFHLDPEIGWSAGHAVCRTVLTNEVTPAREEEITALVEKMQDGAFCMLYRVTHPWYASETLFAMMDGPIYRRYKDLSSGLSTYADKVLAKKTSQRQTFLDQFLASAGAAALERHEQLDELRTLVATASATSSDFQSLFLLSMAMRPDLQRRVQKELDDVLGSDSTGEVLSSDLPHLTYLECVLKETLRYFAPAPMFLRTATQDVALPSGQLVPQGAQVVLSPALTHRNPRHFPDPLHFDPDRFTPEQSRQRHPYAYFPFSAGSRSCIGQRFAMAFGKTVVASVLRRFDVLPDPDAPYKTLADVPLHVGIALSVEGGVRVRLRRRQGAANEA